MATALIADDEPHLAAHLRNLLAAQWPELEVVAVAKNGVDAAERIAALRPDVAFLDIKMPGLSGLEVAQGIEGSTRVVFVTAYDEYAVRAFDRQAVDYLLKPVRTERLAQAIDRLRRTLAGTEVPDDARLADVLRRLLAAPTGGSAIPSTTHLRHVRASSGEQTHQVAVDDVLFFRADEKYTCVQTGAGGELLIRTPIAELVQQLDPARFAQIHRSTIVNLDRVTGTRRDEQSRLFVCLGGGTTELPVSRAYVHLFKAM